MFIWFITYINYTDKIQNNKKQISTANTVHVFTFPSYICQEGCAFGRVGLFFVCFQNKSKSCELILGHSHKHVYSIPKFDPDSSKIPNIMIQHMKVYLTKKKGSANNYKSIK